MADQKDLVKYTVQVPESLDALVRQKMLRENLKLSDAVRAALAQWVGAESDVAEPRPWGRPRTEES